MSISLHVKVEDKDLEGMLLYLQSLSHLKWEHKMELLEKAMAWLLLNNPFEYKCRKTAEVSLRIDGGELTMPLIGGVGATGKVPGESLAQSVYVVSKLIDEALKDRYTAARVTKLHAIREILEVAVDKYERQNDLIP